jgi:transcriptional regulator of acetoin/glycerol metabolism
MTAIQAALAKGGAARSPLVASCSRSAHLRGLDPLRKSKSYRLTAAEFAAARDAMGQMLHTATHNPMSAADALAGALNQPRHPERLEGGERAVLIRALARAQGNASQAARSLGISRATFHRKIGGKA